MTTAPGAEDGSLIDAFVRASYRAGTGMLSPPIENHRGVMTGNLPPVPGAGRSHR